MKITTENLLEAQKVLWEIEGQICNGERKGWGYDITSIAKTISILSNEIMLAKEREKK